jgi:hypothetical protein
MPAAASTDQAYRPLLNVPSSGKYVHVTGSSMAALYLSGRQDPDGGASCEEELSGISLLEDSSSSLELESSSLELDSSSSDEELEETELLDSGSTEELDSFPGNLEELLLTSSLDEETGAGSADVPGEAEVSITAELVSTEEELWEL